MHTSHRPLHGPKSPPKTLQHLPSLLHPFASPSPATQEEGEHRYLLSPPRRNAQRRGAEVSGYKSLSRQEDPSGISAAQGPARRRQGSLDPTAVSVGDGTDVTRPASGGALAGGHVDNEIKGSQAFQQKCWEQS
ncbi:hypothetical protein llap_8404 [Limosa lapponica baueri]|uniref:Uncharacterized protein n=1 Tax=Limosa lapponica baueri TaxID=1758121 RepID=A0A2I0U5N2_LIMLA|nr:hypothetical protein llap_8404 [Limosa lapponica baueri]